MVRDGIKCKFVAKMLSFAEIQKKKINCGKVDIIAKHDKHHKDSHQDPLSNTKRANPTITIVTYNPNVQPHPDLSFTDSQSLYPGAARAEIK